MTQKIQVHYNIDNIARINANYNLIYGEKSNGKSYQVKHKMGVLHYLETGKRFILLRRWVADVTNLWVEQYFSDVDVEKLTNGRYNCISVYRKVIYLAIYDPDSGKTKRGEKIGYVMALSTEQHYSGASFLDVDSIIFEEFMERGCYIAHEPDRLMILYSTIDRKRGTTKLWLVGNTISRVNPYIREWGLDKLVHNMKQGDIESTTIHNEENDVTIALEYCKSSGGKQMAIGSASSMIDSGGWQTLPQPKLPKSNKEYDIVFSIGFQFQGWKFKANLLRDRIDLTETCWFIYPYTKEFSNNILVISDEIKVSKYWQRDIYNVSIKNKRIQNLLDTFKENKIFYASDLVGTDFKQVIDFMIRR